jgi:ATP-dependent Lhr-like helicase
VHHSSLDKEERIRLEKEFKNGQIKSIIATSSLELGIDIGSVDLVIQYGSPRQALRLAQRIGRSGHTHKGVSKGVVISANSVETLETLSIFGIVGKGLVRLMFLPTRFAASCSTRAAWSWKLLGK